MFFEEFDNLAVACKDVSLKDAVNVSLILVFDNITVVYFLDVNFHGISLIYNNGIRTNLCGEIVSH
jgi:hypothetical protein